MRISKFLIFDFFFLDTITKTKSEILIRIPVSFLVGLGEERTDEFTADRIIREVQIIRDWAFDRERRTHWVRGRHVREGQVGLVMMVPSIRLLVRSLRVVIQGEVFDTGAPAAAGVLGGVLVHMLGFGQGEGGCGRGMICVGGHVADIKVHAGSEAAQTDVAELPGTA